jgi:arginine decarboxylase-like protein
VEACFSKFENMSSELLKEQFNTLVNEQKSKLEILREKKKLMNQQKNVNFSGFQSLNKSNKK